MAGASLLPCSLPLKDTMNVRQSDWFKSFIPQILGMVYAYALLWGQYDFPLTKLLLSACTLFGLVVLGFWINDWFDQKSDAVAGKPNMHLPENRSQSWLVLIISVCLAFLPWIYLPIGFLTWGLLGFQILLYISYSAPPLRLKEKPLWGPITDATYAYALPFGLSAYTFALFWNPDQHHQFLIILLGLTQYLAGIRNIIVHQVGDVFADTLTKTHTYVMELGPRKTDRLLRYLLLTETILYSIFLAVMAQLQSALYALLFFFLLQSGQHWIKRSRAFPKHTLLFQESGTLPNTYYQVWQPLLLLALLSFHNHIWYWVVGMHSLLLVPNQAYQLIGTNIMRWLLIPSRQLASLIVNYTIWIFFKTLGVDLQKEGKSARQFLQSKFRS
jgi:4-hydroxybenzoate polyprenyltransferase